MGELNFRNRFSPVFISLFCYRRLFQALLIVFVAQYPSLQVQSMTLQLIMVVMIFGHISAHRTRKNRLMEYFNECVLVLCVYHYFCFTAFVPDAEARFFIGYSLIAVTAFNIAVNVIVMQTVTVQSCIFRCKRMRHRLLLRLRTKKNETARRKKEEAVRRMVEEQMREQEEFEASRI